MTMKTPAGMAADEAARIEAERPRREFEERVRVEVERQLAAIAEKERSDTSDERANAAQEQPMAEQGKRQSEEPTREKHYTEHGGPVVEYDRGNVTQPEREHVSPGSDGKPQKTP